MSDRNGNDLYRNVVMFSPGARNLIRAIFNDVWPSLQAMTEFGIESQEHYEALYYPIRNGELEPAELEAALYSGPKLSELLNSAPSNPHKGITFETTWDRIPPEVTRELRTMDTYRGGPAAPLPDGLDRDKDRVAIAADLVDAFSLGTWPSQVTMKCFHISSTGNYWSLCTAFLNEEITFRQLTDALGDGEKLAELANSAPANARIGRTFHCDTSVTGQENRTAEPARHGNMRHPDRDIDREW